MAIPRKDALTRLKGLRPEVVRHLKRILTRPSDLSVGHYCHEALSWLREMEEVLPHVGKKTAAEWAQWIEATRRAIEAARGTAEDG